MSVNGDWKLELGFVLGAASHSLHLDQEDGHVSGRYRSQYGDQEIGGEVSEDGVIRMRASVRHQACGATYSFQGRVDGDRMEGDVDLGEYWKGTWRATRGS